MGFIPRENEVNAPTEPKDLETVVVSHTFQPATLTALAGAVWAHTISRPAAPAFPPGDPHWKRVAKDRARKKAAKKHKQRMRREGKK